MYTICPTCGTEVTFMVYRCPICSRVLNVFDFHRGDSPDIDYTNERNAPYIYTRGVITEVRQWTDTGSIFSDREDIDYVDYRYTYLYHGKWHTRSTGSEPDEILAPHYEIGDDVIVKFRRGDEMFGKLEFSLRGYF